MKNIKGFTLVELIVVVTILSVLSTIAFLSLKGQMNSARDSVRISNLNIARESLQVSILSKGSIPEPESSIIIYDGNISNSLVKVGKLGEQIRNTLKVSDDAVDPETKEDFHYSKSGKYNKFQLSAELEDPLTLTSTAKAKNINLYQTGYPLNSIYNSDFTIPSSNIDITNVDTTKNYKYIDGKEFKAISGTQFFDVRLNYSCLKKSELGLGNSKTSKIAPDNTSEIEVDCFNEFMQKDWTNIYANNFDDIAEFNRDYTFFSQTSPSTQTVTNGILNHVRPGDSVSSNNTSIRRTFQFGDEIYMQMKFKTSGTKSWIFLDGFGLRYDDSGCVGICLGSDHLIGPKTLTEKSDLVIMDFYINKKENKVVLKLDGKEYYNGSFPTNLVQNPTFVNTVSLHSRHYSDSINIDYLIIATK